MLRALGLRRGAEVRRSPVERRVAPHRTGFRVALSLLAAAAGGCGEKNQAPAAHDLTHPTVDVTLPDVPFAAVDAGIADIGVEAEIAAVTGAPPGRIFYLGTRAEALQIGQIARISFTLPQELKELFGKVSFWGILGPRVDSEGRSPFEIIDFMIDPNNGAVSVGVKPLPGAYLDGGTSLWHLVAEVGEGEGLSYCAYGLPIAEEVREVPDAGRQRRDAGRQRDDAGTEPADVLPPPRDIARGETRPRI